MSNPRVTVIIIFLNAEEFIEEAIQSVLAQTYRDWELLLVDDGSSDSSTRIAQQYAAKYPDQVRYIHHAEHQHCGTGASRNLGVQHARGEYIAFLDADDVWLPNALGEQVAILDQYQQVALVFGSLLTWYSWTGKREDQTRDAIFHFDAGIKLDAIHEPPTLLTRFLQGEGAGTSAIMVRRAIVERVGGFEESFRGLYEDQVFCAKVCIHASVFVASHCWYKYRQHPDSSCSVAEQTGTYYLERGRYLRWLREYLTVQHVEDAALWKALRQEWWRYRRRGVRRLWRRIQRFPRRMKALVRQDVVS